MESTVWMGRLYHVCQWITRLAYINLIWLLFMALGLFVFGAAPATAAMFSVVRKWLKGETEISVFQYFKTAYKNEFFKANSIGAVLLIIGTFLFLDWRLISSLQGTLYSVLMGCLIGVSLLFLIILIYIFPVFVHYEHKTLQYFKTALILGISYPFYTMGMLLAVFSLTATSLFFQGIGLLFFGSTLSFALMYITHQLFSKISRKYNGHES
jgi:uncharacterized membrane protein YesL